MPPEVGLLLARGKWTCLLGLYRWKTLRPWLPHELLQQRIAPSHAPPVNTQSILFGLAEVQSLVSDLRRYADRVIEHHGEEERFQLETHVNFLDGVAHALGAGGGWSDRIRNKMFNAAHLLEALRLFGVVEGDCQSLSCVCEQIQDTQ